VSYSFTSVIAVLVVSVEQLKFTTSCKNDLFFLCLSFLRARQIFVFPEAEGDVEHSAELIKKLSYHRETKQFENKPNNDLRYLEMLLDIRSHRNSQLSVCRRTHSLHVLPIKLPPCLLS